MVRLLQISTKIILLLNLLFLMNKTVKTFWATFSRLCGCPRVYRRSEEVYQKCEDEQLLDSWRKSHGAILLLSVGMNREFKREFQWNCIKVVSWHLTFTGDPEHRLYDWSVITLYSPLLSRSRGLQSCSLGVYKTNSHWMSSKTKRGQVSVTAWCRSFIRTAQLEHGDIIEGLAVSTSQTPKLRSFKLIPFRFYITGPAHSFTDMGNTERCDTL